MFKKRWTSTAVLALILFVIGSVATWLEYSYKPKKEEAEEQEKKLFVLDDKQVASMRLVDGGRKFTLRCLDVEQKLCKPGDNSKWEITEPAKLKADDSNVNSLLSGLNNLSSTETISLKEETPEKKKALLREYRLSPENLQAAGARRVEVTLADGSTRTLYLGDTHPIGDSIFSLIADGKEVQDSKVYLVGTYFRSNFDHDLTHWRDKKVMTLSAHQVDSFVLSGGKGKLSASRKDGQWVIRTQAAGKSEEMTGDIENIDNLLTSATYLTARRFAADNKSDPKGKAALRGTTRALSLELTPKRDQETEPVTLTLYNKGKSTVYATVSNLDPVFELDPNAKERLDKSLNDLRLTKLIASMDRFNGKKLEFSGPSLGGQSLILANEGSEWKVQGTGETAANDKVQNLLDKLSGNRIQEFLSGSKIPKGEDQGIQLKLSDDKGAVRRQLVFWKSEKSLYARDLMAERKEAFKVDSAITDALPWTRDFFAAKKPEAPAASPAPKHAK